MTRIRIVKGNVTEITGGNYTEYSQGNIEFHLGDQIIETADRELLMANQKRMNLQNH